MAKKEFLGRFELPVATGETYPLVEYKVLFQRRGKKVTKMLTPAQFPIVLDAIQAFKNGGKVSEGAMKLLRVIFKFA